MKRILFIDSTNFEDYPTGGHLSFARQMLEVFSDELFLVGITTDEFPIGIWSKKTINNKEFNFFSIGKLNKRIKKPFIPARLTYYLALNRYKRKILSIGCQNVFVQTPEVVLQINNWGFTNICYRAAGVENMLNISRYWFSKYLASTYEKFFYKALSKVNIILAAADKEAIEEFVSRSNGIVSPQKTYLFPTRINTDVFKPREKLISRTELNISTKDTIIVTSGRLGWFKGWKFMIDSFKEFSQDRKNCKFFIIGDGEDFLAIKEYIEVNNLSETIFLPGRQTHEKLAIFLNSADLYIMGSYKEGWCTSLVEAIACGLPVCTTNFSSATDLVTSGYNGYVVSERDIHQFAKNMNMALQLNPTHILEQSLSIRSKFTVSNLKKDIFKYWDLNN